MPEQEPEKKEEKQEEKQEEWDKYRQEASQEKANREKIQAERDTLAEQLDEMKAAQAQIQEQLKTAQAAKTEEDDGLDGTLADPAVVKTIRKLKKQLDTVTAKSQALEEKAQKYEAQEAEAQAKKAKDDAIESVLKPLDKKFGAKYRSAAQKLANDLIAEGKEEVPATAVDSFLFMEKCYQQLADKDKEPEKKSVSTDTGLGGTQWLTMDKEKQGSVEDVAAEMRKEGKWRGAELPE